MTCRRYKCRECEKSFSTKFEYWEHNNAHARDFPFMCPFCQKLFLAVDDYADHVVRHDDRLKSSGEPDSGKCFGRESGIPPAFSSGSREIDELNRLEENSDGSKREFSRVQQPRPDEAARRVTLNAGGEEDREGNALGRSDSERFARKTHGNSYRKEKVAKMYYCTHCNIKMDSVKKYCEHKRELHNFKCENCNNRYSTYERLKKHVCFVSSDGEPFKCSCSLAFTKANHFKVHIGSKPYSCCRCHMQFNRITNLIRHIRTHTKQKPYVCKDCGRGFSQSANLRNHTSIHLGIKAVKCDECNFSCKTTSGLLKHKKKHKEGFMKHSNYVDKRKTSTGSISCPICKKEFPFKRNVGMHMKIHKKEESLCQECGKVFETKSKLTTHYKACHGAPSICQTCGKTFASSILLTAHEKIHVTGKKFSCTKCCKMFSIKNYLVQHMKTHSEGKQYSCNKCGKMFKVAVSLKYHNKICTSSNTSLSS